MLSFFIGLTYIYIMHVEGTDTSKKLYNQLFHPRSFYIHFSCAMVLAATGLYLMLHDRQEAGCFLTPFIYILLIRFSDWAVRIRLNRHILLAVKYDKRPDAYKWWLDGLLSFFLLVLPVLLGVLLQIQIRKNIQIIIRGTTKIDVVQ
ncbi:MAG TPA: hypothetical protein VNS32_11375 [Flavisolibacter sp.]|nr:hypothetical protein [Flavisolibacter sp.]